MFLQDNLQILNQPGVFDSAELTTNAVVQWLRLAVEGFGALVIGIGVVLAVFKFAVHFKDERSSNFNRVRLTLGKFLALALEFQVGADILSTAIAPGWEQIGKLGAIVAIRTILNYFLTRELESERKREEQNAADKTKQTSEI
ncbi:MAG: DUF1622 domain-containing protein [Pyrinomonadaceae bacterium]